MEQRGLFDGDAEGGGAAEEFAPCDPTVPPEARPRLSRQCEAILERLRRGRATNAELAGIALKYTGRLSEVKKAGYDVRVVEHNHRTGLAWYALFEQGQEVGGQETRRIKAE